METGVMSKSRREGSGYKWYGVNDAGIANPLTYFVVADTLMTVMQFHA